jgi:hypothetical protein
MKKRTFLLLEILITFSLLTICSVPLVKQPLKLYKDEMAHLEKMELERLADWSFTEIKEILLKNGIPWDKIPAKGGKSGPFSLGMVTLEIPGCKTKAIRRSFILTGRGEQNGTKDQIYRQLGICVLLNEQKMWFRLPVQKVIVE